MEKVPPAHPSIKCHSNTADRGISIFYNITFFQVVSFSQRVCVGIYIYVSKHAEWQRPPVTCLSSQREGGRLCLHLVIFHCCRFSPPWQAFCFLHDRGSAKVWNIYEGLQDGAPFQGLPLWLRIRAFSLVLNNSCRESICLVRIFFIYLM